MSHRKSAYDLQRLADKKREKKDTKHAGVLDTAAARRRGEQTRAEKEATGLRKKGSRANVSKPKLSSTNRAASGSSPLSAPRESSLHKSLFRLILNIRPASSPQAIEGSSQIFLHKKLSLTLVQLVYRELRQGHHQASPRLPPNLSYL